MGLYIPTDKASLLHTIEATAAEGFVPSDASEPLSKVIVIDAMAVVQGIKKTASMEKLAHLVDAFIQCIKRLIQGYESCRVIFDRYLAMIPNQVLDALSNEVKQICVWSPDTDVLILLVDLVAQDRLPSHVSLYF